MLHIGHHYHQVSGLQSWVDNALTPAQQEKANIKLFQSVEIKSYHCSISTYYQALWLHCPQQQPILSQSELLILWICQLHLSILYTPNLLCAILQHFGIRGCKSPTWGSWATGESQKSNTTLWWMGGWARKEYLWCCQYKCWWISNYTRFGWHDRMMRHSSRLSKVQCGRGGIAEGKQVLALTTNNPSMMKSFQRLFQAEFPWVLVRNFLQKLAQLCYWYDCIIVYRLSHASFMVWIWLLGKSVLILQWNQSLPHQLILFHSSMDHTIGVDSLRF